MRNSSGTDSSGDVEGASSPSVWIEGLAGGVEAAVGSAATDIKASSDCTAPALSPSDPTGGGDKKAGAMDSVAVSARVAAGGDEDARFSTEGSVGADALVAFTGESACWEVGDKGTGGNSAVASEDSEGSENSDVRGFDVGATGVAGAGDGDGLRIDWA